MDVPTDKLQWVKLRSMQVFWPACVYESYTQAAKHGNDTKALREVKPALDAEDRVVYFFGVGPLACHVQSTSGPAPNLQLCVAHEEDISMAPCLPKEEGNFSMIEDFKRICRAHHVMEENMIRAEKNSCFQRACKEATQFRFSVHSDEDASKLFLVFLANSKRASRPSSCDLYPETANQETVSAKCLKSSPNSSPSRTKRAQDPPSSSSRPPIFSPPQSKLTKALTSSPSPSKKMLPGLERIAAKCWVHMLEDGWEIMTQANGQVLYRMPGVSFFNFRPNENIFDSLVKAFVKYLTDWSQNATNGNEDEQSKLIDFMWPMVEASGWVKLSSSNETWYMMPNTPFNECVPNVTIFRSKSLAITKYLEMNGIIQAAENEAISEEKAEASFSEEAADTQEMSEGMEVDSDESNTSTEVEVEDEDSEDGNDERSDESEDDDVAIIDEIPSKKVSTAKNTKAVALPKPLSVKPVAQKLKFDSPVPISIPPFKCTFGKIEGELRARGWYWKPSTEDWAYYMPSCRLKDKAKLVANVDFFTSRAQLEDYLDVSGLYDDIREKLLRDHEQKHSPSSQHKTESERKVDKPKRATPANTLVKISSLQSNGDDDKENQNCNVRPTRTKSKLKRRLTPVKSFSSRRLQNLTKVNASGVKFGDIWSVLSEKGWHYKPGKLEYDYFKPHCSDVQDGVVNVDYFPSKSILIEYLKSSGLWDKAAKEIANDEPIDVTSTDDEEENVVAQKSTPVVNKRKSNVVDNNYAEKNTPKSKSTNKKLKTGSFNTPTEPKRSLSNDTPDNGIESEQYNERISPDAAGSKGTVHETAAGSNLPRKLADCFTPSPGNAKKIKTNSSAGSQSSHHGLFSEAIQKLTLGYSPLKFQYREEEFRRIHDFFQSCFSQRRGSSMYISGSPGCGKSALLKATEGQIAQLYQETTDCEDTKSLVRYHVNAMALNDSSKLYCQLAELLTSRAFVDGSNAFEAIEKATNSSNKRSKTMILILDEIDILLKKNGVESDLCRLFELAHRSTNSFILIGIANQVDFTERHLPLLKKRLPDCQPEVVIFKPYVHQTIELILIDRLGGKDTALMMLNAHGISFLARKIASTTGDIRLALDICRRVLQHRLDAANEAGEKGEALLQTPVPLTEMLRLVKTSLESKSSQIVQSLPRNLQMILFASTRLVSSFATESNSTTGTLFAVDELYACYCDASQDAGVFKPLAFREFKNALETLSAEGLLGANELKKQLVKLLFTPSDLLQSFRNDAYFARLV
uniref:AAA+ ATPase domain-containing protein n=1 Tax=Globisporangium ultimum (strain ATCC 200006 / CBS 805.95 / DAOM BR144) TaxID=431595 RepID=K3WBW7_GLOUD